MKKKKNKKKNLVLIDKTFAKGITLIALIITIIVLLILSGVAISSLKEGGLIDKAQEAEKQHNIARILEKLELLKGTVYFETKEVNLDNYLSELEKVKDEYQVNYIDKTDKKNANVLVEDKYKYLITETEEGEVIIIYEGTAGQLILSETAGTYIYPEEKTVTVIKNESGGQLTVSSSNEEIATATISGNIITIKSKEKSGKAIITVRSEATEKYARKKVEYIATVDNGDLIVTAEPYSGIYDEEAHGIIVTCIPTDATIEYSTDGKNYTGTRQIYKDVGEYTTYYKVTKTGYKTVEGSLTVTIKQAEGELTLSETSGIVTYPTTSKAFTITNNKSGGELSVTSSDESIAKATINGTTVTLTTGTTAGKSTITVTSAATRNHTAKTTQYELTVENGEITVTATPYSGTYDTKAHGITVTTVPSDATITYSSDGTSYSGTNPTYTNVGTYTTYYRVTKTGYKTVEGSLTVTISNTPMTSILKVGDYVKYTPTAKAYSVATTASGTSSAQSFNSSSYTGLWRVLYNDTTRGVQLISNTSVINLTLQGKVGYNNIEGTLNSIAGNYANTTYTSSARSVGSTTSSVATTTGTTTIYSGSSGSFSVATSEGLKVADTNYKDDIAVLENKGMLNINADYWLASRYIYIDGNGAGFHGALIGTFNNYTGAASYMLYGKHAAGTVDSLSYTAGVRPVVKLKTTVKVKAGAGTSGNPWQITI